MIIVVDLDHTLAAAAWRDYMRPDWDAYYRASSDDAPIQPMVDFINNGLSTMVDVVCITTRPEKWRQLTMDWLIRHNVSIDELVMRPNDDFRRSPELKVALATPFKPIMLAIDDREDVVIAYAAAGIPAVQVRI